MWDAIARERAVFEPEEVRVLTAAVARASRKCRAEIVARPEARTELAQLVHNLARTRLRLRKGLRCESDARALADEAAEVFRYLAQAQDVIQAEGPHTPAPERLLSLFSQDYRKPPRGQLA